ncbi:phage terminase large subunit GpA-like protein [Variovorax sp. SG517]|uniref:phage terminase large subunit family protein n=1 Tax=Variovorax sp. SG517 TaxID=2587117 RepID=UPI00159D06C2|nr:terminase gpA endonuclease subunit [Variovorax sp. SG517]NVM87621.1 phage terminase large subunit GpA-like protein [Variovorax sp. SG517]
MAKGFASAEEVMRDAVALLQPPRRIKVSESAAQFLHVGAAGGDDALWDPALTPYMPAPMDRLADRSVEAVVFAGPAQSGKTDGLLLGWMAHSIVSDPCDMMIVQTTREQARDFSKRRVERSLRASPNLRAQVGAGHQDNVLDKQFRNGAMLNIGWPTANQLSGKPIRHVAATDYDRIPLNIDKQGDCFGLLKTRTKSFMSRGRTLIESSPGHEVLDPEWKPRGHGAPPTHGVLGLYNLGDRHRWYWPCLHCGAEFLAEWDNLKWDTTIDDPVVASRTAHMRCPECEGVMGPEHKETMNRRGRWRSEAEVFGDSYQSKIASYWMQGPAAAFQSWESLVYNYLAALKDFELTGNQEKLKATTNTDQGRPYTVLSAKGDGLDAVLLKQRADNYAPQRHVPAEARFVTTAVDVQKHRFVVQVHAWGVEGQCWIIDRFNLTSSDRIGDGGERLKISPFTHAEDWAALDKLLDDEYPVAGNEDIKVQSRMIVCDSGGQDQATNNAYAYALRLKRQSRADRFALIKGASSRTAQRIVKGKPGDDRIKVPLYIINPNIFKDEVAASLAREEPGPNSINLPDWVGEWFFRELTAETRTATGWVKKRKGDNNEGFDLCGYNRVAYTLVGGEKINWAKPPEWAGRALGERMAEKDTVGKTGNDKYLQWLRERGRRINGE